MRNLILIVESFGLGPTSIDVQEDHGAVEGYVVASDREQLPNWFDKHGLNDTALMARLRGEFPILAFLNNLNIDEDARGEGNGTSLFEEFREQAIYKGADAILLIADTAETNEFELVEWYQRLGFDVLAQTSSGPLMLLRL